MANVRSTHSTGRECIDVCALPPDELQTRLELIRTTFRPHVTRTERLADGMAWELGPGMRAQVDALVALERVCCSSLDWRVVELPNAGGVRLEVRGIDPRSSRLAQALDVPRPAHARSRRGPAARIATAGGIGLATAVVLCCLLPIMLAGLGAATLAAPLMPLDRPLPAAVVGLTAAGVGWWRLRQRAATRDAGADCATGCGC